MRGATWPSPASVQCIRRAVGFCFIAFMTDAPPRPPSLPRPRPPSSRASAARRTWTRKRSVSRVDGRARLCCGIVTPATRSRGVTAKFSSSRREGGREEEGPEQGFPSITSHVYLRANNHGVARQHITHTETPERRLPVGHQKLMPRICQLAISPKWPAWVLRFFLMETSGVFGGSRIDGWRPGSSPQRHGCNHTQCNLSEKNPR